MTRVFSPLLTALMVASMCLAFPVPSSHSGRSSRSPQSSSSYVEGQWLNLENSKPPSPAQYIPPSPPLEPLGGDYKIPLEDYGHDDPIGNIGEESGRRSRSRSPEGRQQASSSQGRNFLQPTRKSKPKGAWRLTVGRTMRQLGTSLGEIYGKPARSMTDKLDTMGATREDGTELFKAGYDRDKLKAAYDAIKLRYDQRTGRV